jgi:hypothetical protein
MPDEHNRDKLPGDSGASDETDRVPPSSAGKRGDDIEFTPAERRGRRPDVNPDDDIPFHLPMDGEDDETPDADVPLNTWDKKRDAHNMPTMPIPREPGTPDYKKTLAGSGGLDPNPDFESNQAGNTVQHNPLSQDTLMNMRPVSGAQQSQRAAQPPYVPPAPPTAMPPATTLPPRKVPKGRRILGCSPGCLMIFGGLFATFCGGLTLLTLVLSLTLGSRLEQQLQAQVSLVDQYQNFQSTFLLDRNGQQLYEIFNEGRRINEPLGDSQKPG